MASFADRGGLILSAVADSAAVTGAVSTEQPFLTPQYSLPANVLKIGDVIKVKARAVVTGKNSTETLVLKAYIGTVTLASTAATNLSAADEVSLDLTLTVTALTSSGKIQGFGWQVFGTAGTATARQVSLSSTTLDTTVASLIKFSATWSGSSASNTVVLRDTVVELVR